MYSDTKPCQVCGAAIELGPATAAASTTEPDGPIDERTCTNPDCPTHRPPERTACEDS